MKKRILSAVLSVCLTLTMLPAAALTALADEVGPLGDAALNQTTDTRYPTLAQAVAEAQDGHTIQLLRDETISGAGKGKNQAAVLITSDIILEGDNHTVTVADFALDEGLNPQTHIFSVEEGAQAAIQNLTIEGDATTKHGINVWANGQGEATALTLNNVAIHNCGTAGIVVNHSSVTASGLSTSGNAWGAVNVDNGGTFTLAGTDNQMEEAVKLWTEKPDGEGAVTIDVSQSNLKPVKGEGTGLKGYTYYTDNVADLGEGYNETTQTVYEDLDQAFTSLSAGHTLKVVRSATLDSAATIPAGATLAVEQGVTLTTNDQLSSEGNLVNLGSISGQVTPSQPAGADDYRVTYLVDGQIWYTAVLTQAEGVLTFTQPAAPSKEGFRFDGWSYGDHVSLSGSTVTLTVDSAKTYSFEAQWTALFPVTVSPSDHGQVTANPTQAVQGQEVTLTVAPEEGYVLSSLTASTQESQVTLSEGQDGTYTFLMPGQAVTVEAVFTPVEEEQPQFPFDDVAQDSWYAEAVRYLWQRGLIQGVGAQQFAPTAPSTRAMLMTVLARLDGQDLSGGDSWYSKAVEWAVEQNVSDGTYPGDYVTREQLVTMLYRLADQPAVSQDHLAAFPDQDEVSAWAVDAMNWAVSIGLVQGRGDALAPAQQAARSELATMLHRFCLATGK